MAYRKTLLASIIEQIAQGVVLFGGVVQGSQEFLLHVWGQSSSLAGSGDHFVGDLLIGGGYDFVGCQLGLAHQHDDGLLAEITIDADFHKLYSKSTAISDLAHYRGAEMRGQAVYDLEVGPRFC